MFLQFSFSGLVPDILGTLRITIGASETVYNHASWHVPGPLYCSGLSNSFTPYQIGCTVCDLACMLHFNGMENHICSAGGTQGSRCDAESVSSGGHIVTGSIVNTLLNKV